MNGGLERGGSSLSDSDRRAASGRRQQNRMVSGTVGLVGVVGRAIVTPLRMQAVGDCGDINDVGQCIGCDDGSAERVANHNEDVAAIAERVADAEAVGCSVVSAA